MVLIVSIFTSLIWIRVLTMFDNARPLKSNRTGVRGFFLYGLLSIPLVMILYYLVEPVLFPLICLSPVLEDMFLVGPVEESAKFLVFYLIATRKTSIQEPKDGILHAASVGLAFTVVENILYSVHGMDILLIRSVLTTTGHMSYAAIWGYAGGVYLYTRETDGDRYSFSIVSAALMISAVLHGLYDSFLDLYLLMPALILDACTVLLALLSLSYLKKLSPFADIPFSQHSQAIPRLEEALGNNPDNFVLNKRLALHYIRGGLYLSALSRLKKASRLNPRELSCKFYIALLEYLGHDQDTAGDTSAAPSADPAGTGPAGEKLSLLISKIPRRNVITLNKQAKEVFAVHPRHEEMAELCADLLARKRAQSREAEIDKNISPARSGTGIENEPAAIRWGDATVRSQIGGRSCPQRYGIVDRPPGFRRPSGSRAAARPVGSNRNLSQNIRQPLSLINPHLAARKNRALCRIIDDRQQLLKPQELVRRSRG